LPLQGLKLSFPLSFPCCTSYNIASRLELVVRSRDLCWASSNILPSVKPARLAQCQNGLFDRRAVITHSVASAGPHLSAQPRWRSQQASVLTAFAGRLARFRIDEMH